MRFMSRLWQPVRAFLAWSAEASYTRRKNFVVSCLKNLPRGARVIDVGAGCCQYREHCSQLEYISQDFCQYDGSGDGVGFQSGTWDTSRTQIISDITRIPVPDASFDAALCTDVLEHVSDANAALREIRRIVRPGGKIIITVPTQSDAHQTPFFFSSGYSQYFFARVFEGCPIEINFESGYFETVDQKIYLGGVVLLEKATEKKPYVLILLLYVILAVPLVALLRTLPAYAGEKGSNGLLIVAENR